MKKLWLWLFAAYLFFLTACGGGGGGSNTPSNSSVAHVSSSAQALSSSSVVSSSAQASSISAVSISRLSLAANTQLIIADGISRASLSCVAYDQNDFVVGGIKCDFYAGGILLSGNHFRSVQSGDFEIQAQYGNVKSDSIKVNARENYTYEKIVLPVIFHVVHFGEEVGVGNNISKTEIEKILTALNEGFSDPKASDNPNAVDMMVQFRLAVKDEESNYLSEPGIHRINGLDVDNHVGLSEVVINGVSYFSIVINGYNYSINPQIDIRGDRLFGPNESDILSVKTQWDGNSYLNVWIMPTLYHESAAFSPVMKQEDLVPGLRVAESVAQAGQLRAVIDTSNAQWVIAHEVGHMLGLHHPFSNDDCKTTDYSPDTYSYNKFGTVFDCDGNLGVKSLDNIMGYDFDPGHRVFTYDQRERVRKVLDYAFWLDNLKSSTR